jgi:hypothetical protein
MAETARTIMQASDGSDCATKHLFQRPVVVDGEI